jgi:hypothetical protein
VVASVLEFVTFAQLLIPFTPPDRLHAAGLDAKNEVFADSVGWADISNQVTRIYVDLPAAERRSTVIISAYYGVPGALQVYGNPSLVPDAVSPQLSDYYWLPNDLAATDALMVDYQPPGVEWMCTSPRLIAHLTVPYSVKGLEQGAPVTFCHPRPRSQRSGEGSATSRDAAPLGPASGQTGRIRRATGRGFRPVS